MKGKEKSHKQQLQFYIDSLDGKIERAKWKQSTVLKYNYMPLESAKQKIEEETNRYISKVQNLYHRLQIQTQSQEVQRQVNELQTFATKLLNKISNIEQQIEIVSMDMALSRAYVQEKKESFRYLAKGNVELSKFIIESKSKMNEGLNSVLPVKKHTATNFTEKSLKLIKKMQGEESISNAHQNIVDRNKYSHDFYEECVESLAKSLKSMKASEDVQAGIYLQIMNRKISTRAPTFSLKSKTCDILMDRYKDLKQRKPKKEEDFCMGLETFMGLNWKQIMGIILVKDRNATKLKQLPLIQRESEV